VEGRLIDGRLVVREVVGGKVEGSFSREREGAAAGEEQAGQEHGPG